MGDLGPGGNVFLCYAREDSAWVDELDGVLRGAGFPVWRDTADLWPGQDWRAVIRRAIADGALVFLACFSSRSVARSSGYQNAELALAAEQSRLRRAGDSWLIPVRFDECELPDLDLGGGRTLGGIQRADLFGGQASAATKRLVEAIRRILDAAPAPGVLPGQGSAGAGQVVVGDIPRKSAAYQDRPDQARLVAGRIPSDPPVVLVVTGLRGTGKTQAAAALARQRLAQGWSVVAWMDASSQASLLAGYGELAAALGLAEDDPDSEVAAVRVRRWLENDGGRRCLVVLDNALSAGVLRPFLPTAGLAQVVVTTSRASLADLGAAVPVDVFTEEEAAAFLAERARVIAHRLVLRLLRERAASASTLADAAADAVVALGAMLPMHHDAWRHPDVMREFCPAGAGNRIYGPSLLRSRHPWAMVAVARPG